MELHFNPKYNTNFSNYIYEQTTGIFTNTINNYEDCRRQILGTHKQHCIGIKPEHVQTSLEQSDAVIMDNNSNGFIAFKLLEESQTIYIDLICANKGYGAKLMDTLEILAEKSSFTEIKLKSVTNAVGFYLKNGFKCDKLCSMKKTVANATAYAGGRKKRKSNKKRQTNKTRRYS